jgi:hypothetical protein
VSGVPDVYQSITPQRPLPSTISGSGRENDDKTATQRPFFAASM